MRYGQTKYVFRRKRNARITRIYLTFLDIDKKTLSFLKISKYLYSANLFTNIMEGKRRNFCARQ